MNRPPAQGLLRHACLWFLALALSAAGAATEDWGLFCADLPPGGSQRHGAVVTQVLPGSAAAQAGIQAGDIVTAHAGRTVANVLELDAAIATHVQGAALRLSILRAGRPLDLLLGDAAPAPAAAAALHPQHRQALDAVTAEDWAGAESHARAGLDAEPHNAALWDILGAALQNQKKTEGAAQAYREALRLDPRLPSANVNLGGLMLSQGLGEEGRPYFERAAAGDPKGHLGDLARQRLAGLDMARAMQGEGPAAAARPDGLKALIEVASFEVQAANAPPAIGTGLREMLVTALHGSGYFVVVENAEESRLQLSGERALSQARAPDPGAAGGPAGTVAADVQVSGAVVHFDPKAGGGAFGSPIMGSPFGIIGTRITVSQITIEIRVVDARSGQLLARQQIPGMARSVRGIIAGGLPGGSAAMPSSLDVYRNTPIELALRDCMQKAAYFVANNIPEEYFAQR